ncbi:MarR family transcriptional regulator [Siminovitchia terrae]|uniref:MarR family transcriptional regulator n=1 Tax=Siminovitchia terrae TaxID=1914933 RepID=A0A429XDY8_SIMTE|nr:MarR family transcriptional regulator [Siminovitchia terrae]RST61667.1 MarR family transcriptional regulator [Siminovitchia terrae]GIN92440.1 MarR family transcriptional regulator [Siminovitchia terrae]GIN97174.1 MarR family transcriptional regulator [Siminovitchia terrae]
MKEYLKVIEQIYETFDQFKILVAQEVKEAQQLESFALTPQQEMMMVYIIRNQPVTSNDIAAYLNISKSAVSQVIPKLEEKKMINRQVNPSNRREIYITLGPRGQEYLQLLNHIDELLVRKYYSKVKLEELRDVLAILNKIVE